MGRSIKKGPFVDGHLMEKIVEAGKGVELVGPGVLGVGAQDGRRCRGHRVSLRQATVGQLRTLRGYGHGVEWSPWRR